MTYNHKKYIREAFEGILMQKTSFPVEVVIGDDFSTDETLDIVKSYKNRENIQIKILQRQRGDGYWEKRRKLGRLYNFENIIENCTGKYIALLDGDDYWTDEYKLQKQVEFLEANPDFILCYHDVVLRNQIDGSEKLRIGERKIVSDISLEDFILENNVSTGSALFRNNLLESLPGWFFNEPKGDYAFFILLAEKGRFHYLPAVMGVYRIHEGGIFSSLSQIKQYSHSVSFFLKLKGHLTKDYYKVLNKKISYIFYKKSKACLREGYRIKALKAVLMSLYWRLFWAIDQNATLTIPVKEYFKQLVKILDFLNYYKKVY